MAYAPLKNHQVVPAACRLVCSLLLSSIVDMPRSIINVYRPLKHNFLHMLISEALISKVCLITSISLNSETFAYMYKRICA